MKYTLFHNGSVLREDGVSIPADPTNSAYAEYLQAVASGYVPEQPPADPREVPVSVSRFQACAALLGAGKLDQVEAIMADPSTDRLARLAWSTAQEFRRDSPLVAGLGSMLGLDAAGLDALFIAAGGIVA